MTSPSRSGSSSGRQRTAWFLRFSSFARAIQSSDHGQLRDGALVLAEAAEHAQAALAQLLRLARDLGDGRQLVEGDARLQHRPERVELALGGRPGSPRARVPVPRAGEAGEARAAAVPMRGEHRADAALPVGVGADDDAVRLHAGEHGPARLHRKAVDGDAKVAGGTAAWHEPLHRIEDFPPDANRDRRLSVRLGLNVGYWGLGMTAADQLEVVREAEAAEFDSVWAAEAYGSDAATVLAWLAAQTSRIRIGSAIFQMPGRSPAMTAMTAATLDQLSGGRHLLGIGTSGPQVAEGWHGQRFAKQLQRTREYVEILRMALDRQRLEFDGETYQLPLPDGPGKVLKLMITPVQERIPIYLAAIGPNNTKLAGEICDGYMPFIFAPERAADA